MQSDIFKDILVPVIGGLGIFMLGLESYGLHALHHVIDDAAKSAAHVAPAIGATLAWIVSAAGAGILGLVIGAALIALTGRVIGPGWTAVKLLLPAARRRRA